MKEKKVRNQINFRVTEEEYERLKRKAELANLSPSMYAKKQALQGKVKAPVITRDVGQLIIPEISKIGSNINQLAKKASMNMTILPSEYKEVLAEFETLWAYVLDGKKPRLPLTEENFNPRRAKLDGPFIIQKKFIFCKFSAVPKGYLGV